MANESFTVIGVLKERKSYDKYLKREFANYTGKYILATEEEIEKRYSDTSKYRYIMDYSWGGTRTVYTNTQTHSSTVHSTTSYKLFPN